MTVHGTISAAPQHIAIVTDAWHPQVNGVVRTIATTCEILRRWGHRVSIISPEDCASIPAPTYPEIRLAISRPGAVARKLRDFAPEAIHIATEGPLGMAARRYCGRAGTPFTTAYHTQFPDYFARRTGLSAGAFWPYIRWFHRKSQRIMVATETIRAQLREQGLTHLSHWSRGVDLTCFTPDAHVDYTATGGTKGAYPEVRGWLEKALAPFPMTVHYISNTTVELKGDEASSRTYVINPMGFPKDDGSLHIFTVGGYTTLAMAFCCFCHCHSWSCSCCLFEKRPCLVDGHLLLQCVVWLFW